MGNLDASYFLSAWRVCRSGVSNSATSCLNALLIGDWGKGGSNGITWNSVESSIQMDKQDFVKGKSDSRDSGMQIAKEVTATNQLAVAVAPKFTIKAWYYKDHFLESLWHYRVWQQQGDFDITYSYFTL
jgi:hypothetical protein